MAKKKIFCWNNGQVEQDPPLWAVLALCEDGRAAAQHGCSDPCYMEHDIGLTSTFHHDDYDKLCGVDGWELEWVDRPSQHEGFKLAYIENQKALQAAAQANLSITQAHPNDSTPAFLVNDVTIGELVRFLNTACVKAARENDQDAVNIYAHLGEKVEYALNLYRQSK